MNIIEKIQRDLPWHGDVSALDIGELCALAKEGLAKRPRPIDEASKDGTLISRKYVYIVHPVSGELYLGHWNPDGFSKKPRPFWDYAMLKTTSSRANQPTHFIPLSALTVKP